MDARFKSVEDNYSIDPDEMHVRALESDYWKTAERFYDKVKTRSVGTLTEKQRAWLELMAEQLGR